MIGKEQLSLEMVNPLICNIGYWKTIVDKKEPLFPFSSKLINDYMKIIIYEERDGVLYFCICHLLKAALNKGESEKEKKEVEKSLLALTRTKMFSV
ncbi:uncharacterized protein MONOS_7181 [Monocercomonoides exilis]|uniref:uncharacterized protein n=1 Tax=Monocercomonoides exilis TaxID=2049356 RepID=UPI00355A48B4|nr:hypothetical protein MONOS_7181 [Monocercomonoides exilis]|eukprot:MONOS_7181.1-p1 / transcript=MONOS_7181.1 / gene=MONOS_7181 / organism=Monocercomonoides_exilis_PA203 / gene_product=unspecified product / transcript_product=unspecified product / location=Mono_scaffold00239:74597-74965(-) / protein_length=96 / sequence_SO=supercontig / SO=protein_coding / is_pseudo=false